MADRPGHVTAAEAGACVRYCEAVAQFLGLPRWRFVLNDEPSGTDTLAQVVVGLEGYTATLYLGADWMGLDESERRDVLTHEVLHLTHHRVTIMTQKDTKPYMAAADRRDWWKRLNRELELMVDLLAGALAETVELKRAWRESRV